MIIENGYGLKFRNGDVFKIANDEIDGHDTFLILETKDHFEIYFYDNGVIGKKYEYDEIALLELDEFDMPKDEQITIIGNVYEVA